VKPDQPRRIVAYACLALSMSLVGSYVALSKPLAMVIPVFLLAWMRFGIGAVAMLGWLKKPTSEPPLTPEMKRLLFLESLFGNFLFTLCMMYGVSLTSAVYAGVIMASIPAVVALMSWSFLGERIGWRIWVSIGLAGCGIALLALFGTTPHSGTMTSSATRLTEFQTALGVLLLFGAVVCEAAYSVIGKRLTQAMGPKRITSLINLWGFVLSTPMGLCVALEFDFQSVPAPMWLLLVFYALAACVWTVWLWMTGLKVVPAAQGGVFTVMLPISAALVGVLALGESLDNLQLLALGIALAGVLLATLPRGVRN
jgi:drug/metabolite transporter (DMT)-like permease